MNRIEEGGLSYYRFEEEPFSSVTHGFFTRNGGVSPEPWNSLNLSTTGGDSRKNVIENRRRIFDLIHKPVSSIFDTWQVHGTKIIETETPRGLERDPIQADGIITKNPNVTLFMRFADCVPLLFLDEKKEVIGIAHAGWMGTIDAIAVKMIDHLVKDYDLLPGDISVGIGPCICAEHYIIKDDVLQKVKEKFPNDWNKFVQRRDSFLHFDLPYANQVMLEKAGVNKVIQSGICTAANLEDWFSHRAERGSTGRFAALISKSTK